MEFLGLSYNKCKFLTKIKDFQLLNLFKADQLCVQLQLIEMMICFLSNTVDRYTMFIFSKDVFDD